MNFIFFLNFLFGLGIGSFLNVVIFRYDPGRPVFSFSRLSGRSRCPFCKKTLSWYELFPLASFLIQKGRCRGCRRRLSFQYPLVEFLSGLIFAAVPLYFGRSYNVLGLFYAGQNVEWWHWINMIWILAFLVFLLVAFIDYYHKLIPDELNLALFVLGTFLILVKIYYSRIDFLYESFLGNYVFLLGWFKNIWLRHLIAASAAALIFGAIILFSRGRGMGLGDLKLGIALGWLMGWPDILPAILLSFMIGGVFGLFLIFLRKKRAKDAIPFGPFLIFGAVLTVFFGNRIIEGYLKLFGLV